MSTELAVDKQLDNFRALVDRIGPRLEEVLPKHLTHDRLAKLALVAATSNPSILACSTRSVALALMTCAELGLEPGSTLGHIYLIPYKDVLTPVIGYKGFLELALRSGRVRRIWAGVAFKDEVDRALFTFTLSPPDVRHRADGKLINTDPANLMYAYCCAELTTGGVVAKILNRHQVEERKKSAQGTGRSDSPWRAQTEAMWRKTAVRALLGSGTVPLSPRMEHAMHVDGPSVEAEIIDLPEEEPLKLGDHDALLTALEPGA